MCVFAALVSVQDIHVDGIRIDGVFIGRFPNKEIVQALCIEIKIEIPPNQGKDHEVL